MFIFSILFPFQNAQIFSVDQAGREQVAADVGLAGGLGAGRVCGEDNAQWEISGGDT